MPHRTDGGRRGFTLAEVLVALLLLAIIIPVALQGVGAVSRSAVLGQRKARAMRVADRVLNEQVALVTLGQPIPNSASGTEVDGDTSYPWTMQTKQWARDNMMQMTVTIKFMMQGMSYEMKSSTLYDPAAAVPGIATSANSTL
jgi:prepilin-type N-terminal cleavage/methylation domain-containing protein